MKSPIQTQGLIVLGSLMVLFSLVSSGELLANELAVPAEFVRYIKMPGLGDPIDRPNTLFYDRFHEELLVADSGNNRVVIFGSNGVLKFSFSLTEIMSSPRGVATDPDGHIYVLGTTANGLILHRFDFDGVSLGGIGIPREISGIPVNLTFLACNDQGTLFALDYTGCRILVFGSGDELVDVIQIDQRDTDVEIPSNKNELGTDRPLPGAMVCVDNILYVPISNYGTVHRYSTNGDFLGSIGYFGAKPGTLNFPVAVDVSPEGIILVLDRNRYSVVCFSPDNKFLGEFGGRGYNPGWFVGPALLAVPSAEWAIVGQVYKSRIQVCAIPEFIRAKIGQPVHKQGSGEESAERASSSARLPFDVSQRRLSERSRHIGPTRGGEFPLPNSTGALNTHILSFPEVSE